MLKKWIERFSVKQPARQVKQEEPAEAPDFVLKDFTGQPLTEEHARYIQLLVEQAGKVDRARKVFGAKSHGYRLKPVAPIEKIERFEEKYQVVLPPEYRFFLTQVGDGGAGPFHGLYSLDKAEAYHQYPENMKKSAWIDQKLTKEEWLEVMTEPVDATREEDDLAYDRSMELVHSGIQLIGTQGCTYDNLLMLNGAEAGKVVYIDWNLDPEWPPALTGQTFLEWYESYFKEIIRGNSVQHYGNLLLQTEEQLVEAYSSAKGEEKHLILASFSRFPKVAPTSLALLKKRDDPELDALRLELLFSLDPAAGLALFDQLIQGANPAAAIRCARQMPESHKDAYYHQMVSLLYLPETEGRQRILFFLTDCSSLNGEDLVPLALDDSVDEELRTTAIWVISKTPDKQRFLAHYIEWLRGDSYRIAHSALQGISDVADQRLLDTYGDLLAKYPHDQVMRANLKSALAANGIEI